MGARHTRRKSLGISTTTKDDTQSVGSVTVVSMPVIRWSPCLISFLSGIGALLGTFMLYAGVNCYVPISPKQSLNLTSFQSGSFLDILKTL